MTTKREFREENERLRERLEEAYDVIGDALGLDDNRESNPPDSDDDE
jgi:hypothetical protein